jgi:hypothetical protein
MILGGENVLTAFHLRGVGAFGGVVGEVVAAIFVKDIVADLVVGEEGDWTIGNGASFLLCVVRAFGGVVAAIFVMDNVADLVVGEEGDWTIRNGASFLLRGVGAFGGVMAAIFESDIVANLVLGEVGDWPIGYCAFFRNDLDILVGIFVFLFFFSASFFCRARISL